jgi:hypothetical protein
MTRIVRIPNIQKPGVVLDSSAMMFFVRISFGQRKFTDAKRRTDVKWLADQI